MENERTEWREVSVLSRVICNGCGREIPLETADHFHAEKTWGYFSAQDGRRDSFDLCEACYHRLTAGFAVPLTTTKGETGTDFMDTV